jgi:hypothetical protein
MPSLRLFSGVTMMTIQTRVCVTNITSRQAEKRTWVFTIFRHLYSSANELRLCIRGLVKLRAQYHSYNFRAVRPVYLQKRHLPRHHIHNEPTDVSNHDYEYSGVEILPLLFAVPVMLWYKWLPSQFSFPVFHGN